MKITFKDFSKLNPHIASRILTIISERITYGWSFRELYPEYYHPTIKKESPIFIKPSEELLFDFFTRMFNLLPLTYDEFSILSSALLNPNGIPMNEELENITNYSVEIQLKWFKAIHSLVVNLCMVDCSTMATEYNKIVADYSKENLTLLNYLYLSKYDNG